MIGKTCRGGRALGTFSVAQIYLFFRYGKDKALNNIDPIKAFKGPIKLCLVTSIPTAVRERGLITFWVEQISLPIAIGTDMAKRSICHY
jgi:hypothetical protein